LAVRGCVCWWGGGCRQPCGVPVGGLHARGTDGSTAAIPEGSTVPPWRRTPWEWTTGSATGRSSAGFNPNILPGQQSAPWPGPPTPSHEGYIEVAPLGCPSPPLPYLAICHIPAGPRVPVVPRAFRNTDPPPTPCASGGGGRPPGSLPAIFCIPGFPPLCFHSLFELDRINAYQFLRPRPHPGVAGRSEFPASAPLIAHRPPIVELCRRLLLSFLCAPPTEGPGSWLHHSGGGREKREIKRDWPPRGQAHRRGLFKGAHSPG